MKILPNAKRNLKPKKSKPSNDKSILKPKKSNLHKNKNFLKKPLKTNTPKS
jgi:hypothetical protein